MRTRDRRAARRRAAAGASRRASTCRRSSWPAARRRFDGRRARHRATRRALTAGPADADRWPRYLRARAVHRERRAGDRRRGRAHGRRASSGTRARAERLMREVNALLEKKPTVSLPSAREVLRTKVGDCNEHTALYVALARALGIPARIDVGLVFVRGAFYYHAWPEVYIDEGRPRLLAAGRSHVQPVSGRRHAPAAAARRARQADRHPAAHRPAEDDRARSRAGAQAPSPRPRRPRALADAADARPLSLALPTPRRPCGCWAAARAEAPDDCRPRPRKRYGEFTAVDGVSLDVQPGQIHGFLGPNGAGKTTTIRMIAGLLKPTAGRILVNGHDLATRARGREGGARLHSRPAVHLREADRRRVPALSRRALRHGRRGHRHAHQRDARDLRAGAVAARAGRELLARHEAAAGDERGVPAPAEGGAGGRADGRPRPARRAADQGRVPPDERARRRHPDEHAHAGSGAGDVRRRSASSSRARSSRTARWTSCGPWATPATTS